MTQREAVSVDERADIVLRSAWGPDRAAGAVALARWPDLGDRDFAIAACTGRLEVVSKQLDADPGVARRRTGSLGWEPLQYLAYLRLPGGERHGPDIARLLLDTGADPNARFDDGWGNAFTVLTGLIGAGESRAPPHPSARECAALVIERGADPFDSQALYNTSLGPDDTTWLEFLWDHSVRHDRAQAWLTVQAHAIGGSVQLPAIDYLLGNAVAFGHRQRARWLLDHGARAAGINASSKRPLRDEALLRDDRAMAALLEEHGAPHAALDEATAFKIAVLRLDREAARAIAARRPEVLRDPELAIACASHGRSDVLALLFDLGMPVDLRDGGGQRALHKAAENGRLDTVRLLIERGADIDAPSDWAGGPLGYAAFARQREVAAVLAPLSRDVNPLTFFGCRDRLAALFDEDPQLVNASHVRTTNTPLFCLPDDEAQAIEMADFLLSRGADATYRNRDGLEAAAFVRRRGLLDAADFIARRTARQS